MNVQHSENMHNDLKRTIALNSNRIHCQNFPSITLGNQPKQLRTSSLSIASFLARYIQSTFITIFIHLFLLTYIVYRQGILNCSQKQALTCAFLDFAMLNSFIRSGRSPEPMINFEYQPFFTAKSIPI